MCAFIGQSVVERQTGNEWRERDGCDLQQMSPARVKPWTLQLYGTRLNNLATGAACVSFLRNKKVDSVVVCDILHFKM